MTSLKFELEWVYGVFSRGPTDKHTNKQTQASIGEIIRLKIEKTAKGTEALQPR